MYPKNNPQKEIKFKPFTFHTSKEQLSRAFRTFQEGRRQTSTFHITAAKSWTQFKAWLLPPPLYAMHLNPDSPDPK